MVSITISYIFIIVIIIISYIIISSCYLMRTLNWSRRDESPWEILSVDLSKEFTLQQNKESAVVLGDPTHNHHHQHHHYHHHHVQHPHPVHHL